MQDQPQQPQPIGDAPTDMPGTIPPPPAPAEPTTGEPIPTPPTPSGIPTGNLDSGVTTPATPAADDGAATEEPSVYNPEDTQGQSSQT